VSDLLTKIQLLLQNYGKVEIRSICFPFSLLKIKDMLREIYRFLRAFFARNTGF